MLSKECLIKFQMDLNKNIFVMNIKQAKGCFICLI